MKPKNWRRQKNQKYVRLNVGPVAFNNTNFFYNLSGITKTFINIK